VVGRNRTGVSPLGKASGIPPAHQTAALVARVSYWHDSENLGGATTSSAILGHNRRAEGVDAMPARDPKEKLTVLT